jgi:hypothetical protein
MDTVFRLEIRVQGALVLISHPIQATIALGSVILFWDSSMKDLSCVRDVVRLVD